MAVTMSLQYDGALRCTLVHDPSTTRLCTDAPKDNAGRGESFSPTDLVGAALLSCAITTMAIKAPKAGLAFSEATGRVMKDMTTSPPRRIAKLTVEIALPKAAEAHSSQLEEMARTCPVALSLSRDVEVEMRFAYE